MFNLILAEKNWDRLTTNELILIGMFLASWLIALVIRERDRD